MPGIIGVAQLNRYISLKLKSDIKLSGLTVRGEITDFKVHFKSGHAYFALKEEGSQIRCVMFRSQLSRVRSPIENGMRVLLTGSLEVYEPNGVYQLIAGEIAPFGIGEAFMRTEAIKEKLAKQGLFDESRKKPLPPLPKRIAVVTSQSGAALQDVLNILGRRYPVGEVTIFPAQVQGERAHLTIAEALKKADVSGADVLILTRGGGSYEDLMPFNTEEAAAAVAACRTPVITAVGHETDTTLVDYAADVRAPTPSAAAELCAPELGALIGALDEMKSRIEGGFRNYLEALGRKLDGMGSRLAGLSPAGRLERESERLERLSVRMENALSDRLKTDEGRLERNASRLGTAYEKLINEQASRTERLTAELAALDPYRVLERGYAIALMNGAPVTSAESVRVGDELTIRFRGSGLTVTVTGKTEINEQ